MRKSWLGPLSLWSIALILALTGPLIGMDRTFRDAIARRLDPTLAYQSRWTSSPDAGDVFARPASASPGIVRVQLYGRAGVGNAASARDGYSQNEIKIYPYAAGLPMTASLRYRLSDQGPFAAKGVTIQVSDTADFANVISQHTPIMVDGGDRADRRAAADDAHYMVFAPLSFGLYVEHGQTKTGFQRTWYIRALRDGRYSNVIPVTLLDPDT